MSRLPDSIPRAAEARRFFEEPLGFLARARAEHGDVFVLRDGGPVFSRSPDCAGALAVFGPARHRAVLGDIELFGMPVSAARHLSLSKRLVNLNRGLHSMRGDEHVLHQRALMRVLGERGVEARLSAVRAGLEAFARGWRVGQTIGLLGEMRRLALEVSTRLLFGDEYDEAPRLASLLRSFFQLRREVASPFGAADEASRAELVALGDSLDRALRRHVRWCRKQSAVFGAGLLAALSGVESEPGARLSEDELVAHANVLFVSTNEPIAASLTWTLLILSQLPSLRRELRLELAQAPTPDASNEQGRHTPLLNSVINESLRVLTPNALMVRVTTRPAVLEGVALPERCEIVLCPFLAHRDAERFPRPDEFLPSRWDTLRPSPFEYFPFGAGGHACVGRLLATHLIRESLASLLPRYDLSLSEDQEIDWRIHIIFLPRSEPAVTVSAAEAPATKPGRLLGPVGELIVLNRT
ncbi:MAG TPA: cytochrome P450 [Pyrinomonadaceae bacterium]|jgi:cytochrome P450|nr:cytochrome P450 [Pyrinomonadaceae bacterium]